MYNSSHNTITSYEFSLCLPFFSEDFPCIHTFLSDFRNPLFSRHRAVTIIFYTHKCSERRQRLHSLKLLWPPGFAKKFSCLTGRFIYNIFSPFFPKCGAFPLWEFFCHEARNRYICAYVSGNPMSLTSQEKISQARAQAAGVWAQPPRALSRSSKGRLLPT